tara:strand:+ start:26 stop:220 length:195 start_codon:yes stop_codon:yes gene_type:complete
MTALPMTGLSLISWFRRPARTQSPQPEVPEDDLRREYLMRITAAEGCVGEHGVQGLMGLFPRDF